DVNLAEGWVRVFGKGSKERMIPVHERAVHILRAYLQRREEHFARKTAAPEVFLSRSGRRLSRVQFWRDMKALGRKAGLDQGLHPHLLRHSFASAAGRSGPAGGAGAAGPREFVDDADLYAPRLRGDQKFPSEASSPWLI